MNTLTVAELTSEAFAPFGTIGLPLADGGHGTGDVPLDLSHGRPRFYIMRLEGRAGLAFEQLARHDRVTQCLGTIDGLPWLIAVAPAGVKEPTLADIRAFRIPPRAFIALHRGTWHAGPYFTEGQRDFYNLELADTNTADYTTCHLAVPARFAT
ncbi:MAG TPA: ureidoglycolate lyase [Stellaceae bacterium]|jgi:ureidoglycolate lyase|nr:ureidoglycolate lyase [Stellaceae bacterium]